MKLFSFARTCSLILVMVSSLSISCKQEVKPITKEEAKDFANKLEISITRRDPAFYNNAIDAKGLSKKADFASGSNSKSFQKGLEDGMKMGNTMIKSLSKKGTYELVKQYEKDTKQHLIFRLYDKGSINYHDLELIRVGGEVKIADMYIYTSGENLSETLHGIFLQMQDVMDDKSAMKGSDVWLKKAPFIRTLILEEKYDEALESYNLMPEDIKKGRAFQILHIEICSGLGLDKYDSAISEYKKLFPGDSNIELLLLDGYIMHQEYDKALNGINAIDKMINKDPLLDYHRYLCYNLKKDTANAKRSLLQLTKNMPDFEDGIIELIATYLEEKDYASAKPWIKKFKMTSAFDQTTLTMLLANNPGYDNFE